MTQSATTSTGVIGSLIAGVAIYGLALGTTFPLLGIVLSAQVDATWNGVNAAANGLGLLAGVAVVPAASRRLGAGRTAIVGVLLMAASLAILALADGFWPVFAARVLLGCGANLLFVVAETALNVFVSPARRGRVMGVYSAAVAFGFVAGPAVVALAPDRPALLLLGCAVVAAATAIPVGRVRRPIDRAVLPAPLGRVLPSIAAAPFAFGFLLLASAVDAVVLSLLPLMAIDQSYSMETGVVFVTVFHIGLMAGQPLVGVGLDRVGRRRTVIACCAVSLACTAALAAAAPDVVTAALLMALWGGANYGLYTTGLALIGDRFADTALSAATAAFAIVYAVASVLAPVLAGGALQFVGAAGFYLGAAGLYLAAVAAGLAFFRPPEPTLRPCPAPGLRG